MYKIHKTKNLILMCCMLLVFGLTALCTFNNNTINASAEIVVNPNLFNKAAVIAHSQLIGNGVVMDCGTTTPLKRFNVTDYIAVTGDFTISGTIYSESPYEVQYYDTSKNYLGYFRNTGSINGTYSPIANTVYIRFSIVSNDLSYCKVENGSAITPYIEYGEIPSVSYSYILASYGDKLEFYFQMPSAYADTPSEFFAKPLKLKILFVNGDVEYIQGFSTIDYRTYMQPIKDRLLGYNYYKWYNILVYEDLKFTVTETQYAKMTTDKISRYDLYIENTVLHIDPNVKSSIDDYLDITCVNSLDSVLTANVLTDLGHVANMGTVWESAGLPNFFLPAEDWIKKVFPLDVLQSGCRAFGVTTAIIFALVIVGLIVYAKYRKKNN